MPPAVIASRSLRDVLRVSTGGGGEPPAGLPLTLSCLRPQAFSLQANTKYVPSLVDAGIVSVLENLRDLPPLVVLSFDVPSRLPDLLLFVVCSE